MKWLVRFLLWGTPLTWLATTFYVQYLRFLTGVALALFAIVGIEMRLVSLDVLAPVDLAIFGALALASYDVAWPLRLARLGLGLIVLFVLEVVMLMFGLVVFLIMGVPLSSPWGLLFQNLSGVVAWAASPIVWVVLFKPRVLQHAIAQRRRPRPSTASTLWLRRSDSSCRRPSIPVDRSGPVDGAHRSIGEEQNCVGDIVRRREATHGHPAGDVAVGVMSPRLRGHIHLGLDPAGADGVHANAAPTPFGGERAGQSDQPVLRGVVGGSLGHANQARDRGHVDDAAAPDRQHARPERLREQERSDEVHLEDAPIVVR
jgi:hypothetical protein